MKYTIIKLLFEIAVFLNRRFNFDDMYVTQAPIKKNIIEIKNSAAIKYDQPKTLIKNLIK